MTGFICNLCNDFQAAAAKFVPRVRFIGKSTQDHIDSLGSDSWWLRWKRVCLQCRRRRFNPWVRKILWREWQPTPVFLTAESHGQRSLVGYTPWGGYTELDTTERLTPSLISYQKWRIMTKAEELRSALCLVGVRAPSHHTFCSAPCPPLHISMST